MLQCTHTSDSHITKGTTNELEQKINNVVTATEILLNAVKNANFSEEWMEVKSISIEPFLDELSGVWVLCETYPLDSYRI